LYPGALVQGNPSYITTGQLKPIPMQPGSGTLTLAGAHLEPSSGGSVTRHVSPANGANVSDAVASLQGQKFNPSSVDAVASDFQVVTSSKQATLDAKASFSYGPVGASGFFNTANDSTQSHVLFTLREVYYDIAYDPDIGGSGLSDLDAFFAPGTTAAQAQACGCMSTANPPMYVKKVTYGSEFLFMASSTADSSDLKAGLQAAVKFGFSASASVSTEQKALLDQTSIKVLAVGGDTKNLATVISGSLGNDGKDVLSALKTYAQAAIADPDGAQLAQPIAYTLDYIDNTPVGEFAPQPDAKQPPANTDTTSSMRLTVTTTDQDKDGGDPWTVSLTVPESSGNKQVLNAFSPSWCTTLLGRQVCSTATDMTFGNNSTYTVTVPLGQSVPVYDLAGATLRITDSGHSWHGGVNVDFLLPDNSWYRTFTSYSGMYWNDDNTDPHGCNTGHEISTYTFSLNEVNDPKAIAAACGTAS
ncbi:MAG: thiol-activated cytolysin family protein, partial [Solirubrobacteraceae bacterium]